MDAAARPVEDGEIDVSLILATHDRAASLERTLGALAAQELGGIRWEVLVVDNASSDATPEVLARMGAALPLVALREPRLGKSLALNRALDVARGRLLVFLDDDVTPVKRFVAEMVAASRRWPDEVAIFGGPVLPELPEGTAAWIRDHPFVRPGFAKFFPDLIEEGEMDLSPFGANFAVRASAVRGARFDVRLGPRGQGGFLMGEDTDFIRRLREQGARVVYVPTAGVKHKVHREQISLSWACRRGFRLARWHAHEAREHPHPRLPGLVGTLLFPLFGRVLYLPYANAQRLAVEAALAASYSAGFLYEFVLRTTSRAAPGPGAEPACPAEPRMSAEAPVTARQ